MKSQKMLLLLFGWTVELKL